MTTSNKPMTGEQLDELMTVAVNMQRSGEMVKDRGAAMFAHAVQIAVMEIRVTRSQLEESRCKLTESERYGRQADITIENLERKVEQLAAENAGLKSVDVWMNADEVGGSAADKAIENGATPEEATRAGVQAVIESIKTPATDAFMAEVRAQGVEMFAAYCGEENSVFVETKAYYRSLPDAAYEFAAQLRQEAK
ncbi:UNVERIFIED_ORG: hypothetical protein M2382_003662 [Enterobacter sp. BIGb0239]